MKTNKKLISLKFNKTLILCFLCLLSKIWRSIIVWIGWRHLSTCQCPRRILWTLYILSRRFKDYRKTYDTLHLHNRPVCDGRLKQNKRKKNRKKKETISYGTKCTKRAVPSFLAETERPI